VLGQARSEKLMQAVWALDTCTDISALTALCALSA
jgi:hypothetical protein